MFRWIVIEEIENVENCDVCDEDERRRFNAIAEVE
jgi:hypothetical protein